MTFEWDGMPGHVVVNIITLHKTPVAAPLDF
jgi:hypothetical protein